MTRNWLVTGVGIGVCAVVLAVSSGQGALQARRPEGNDAYYQELDLFVDALKIVQEDYVEEAKAEPLI